MPGNDFPLRGQNPVWFNSLDAASQREWRSLARESDPELYQEGLLSFAGRQAQRNHEAVAGAIYGAMLEDPASPDSSALARARERLAVLNGGGTFGGRAEYLLRHVTQELNDPTMIAAMGTASAVFRVTRLATLARLGSEAPGLLTRGWGASGLASVAGFALEAPAFTLTHRVGRAAMGQSQDWSASALRRDLASSYMVLGAMKLGSRGASALQGLGGYRSTAATALFQQSGMFGGILISQALERRLGWRPAASTEAAAADALVTWLQFNAAGRLSQSVLGPRFHSWEQGMDAQTTALERAPRAGDSGFGAFSPELAAVGPALSLQPRSVEPVRPPMVLMSASKFGDGFERQEGIGGPQARGEEVAAPPVDRLRPFWRVEVPRIVRSNVEGEAGPRTFPYRLVLEDFNTFLRDGGERVIATRDGGEIRLRLLERDVSKEGHEFLPAGLPGYRFEILEGETQGIWSIFAFKDAIMSFNLVTDQMRPGVGGIVLDWMSTQAAVERRQAQFAAVTNLVVFLIIEKRGLIDERSAVVEAHQWGRRHRRQSIPLGRFGDWSFLQRNMRGYYNIWAFPRQSLLPPELRSTSIPRRSGPNGAYSYDLNIEPLRRYFAPGFEGIIARRDGRELKAKVLESTPTSGFDRFMPAGTHRISLKLMEGEQANGQVDLYVEPHRLSLANIERGDLPAGTGSIVLDWVYTQAAARGASVDILNIRNPHIWEILNQRELFDPNNAQVELGYWDFVFSEFQPLTSGTYGQIDTKGHYRVPSSLLVPVAQLRSRPNLNRVPESLLPLDTEKPSR